MEPGLGWLVVLNVKKSVVRLDLTMYEAKERDQLVFQSVPPGLHYLGEGFLEPIPGCWFELQPKEVLVKVFNRKQKQFEDASPETIAEYQKLVSGGTIDQNVKAYSRAVDAGKHDRWVAWQKLTTHLELRNFPIRLHLSEAVEPPVNLSLEERENWLKYQKTRFEQALFDTHQGNAGAFLAEFEIAFLRQQINPTDSEALNRWNYLVQAIYNAGERGIVKVPDLFVNLIDTLIMQFALTFDAKLKPGYVAIGGIANRIQIDLVSGAEYLIEDMIDSGIEGVVEKGEEFAAYLKQRGISPN